jgi:cell division protein FtsX
MILTVVVITLILPNILFSGSTYLYSTLAEFNLEHLISVVSIDIDPEDTDALLKQSNLQSSK